MASELEARTKNALKQFDNNMAGIFDRKSFYEGDKYSAEAGKPRLNSGQLCFKYTLLGVNVVFLVFGAVLMGVGSYALNNQISILAGQSIPTGLIVLGVFIMLLALLGGISAWREHRALLGVYFIFLLIFTVILLAVGIAVYVQQNQASTYIAQGWNASGSSVQLTLQNVIGCCGLNTPGDTGFGCPLGCPNNDCTGCNGTGATSVCPSTRWGPCLPQMVSIFQSSFNTAGGAAIAFAVFMFVGLGLVCYLMSGIKRKQEETDIAKLRTGGMDVDAGVGGVDGVGGGLPPIDGGDNADLAADEAAMEQGTAGDDQQ